MQMNVALLIALPLRFVTVVWPLATEVLALLWWARSPGASTLPTLAIVAAYVGLAFAPNRFLFSRTGLSAVVLLLSASLLLLLLYWGETSGFPEMIWVHLGFGIAWLATITIERFVRGKRGK